MKIIYLVIVAIMAILVIPAYGTMMCGTVACKFKVPLGTEPTPELNTAGAPGTSAGQVLEWAILKDLDSIVSYLGQLVTIELDSNIQLHKIVDELKK